MVLSQHQACRTTTVSWEQGPIEIASRPIYSKYIFNPHFSLFSPLLQGWPICWSRGEHLAKLRTTTKFSAHLNISARLEYQFYPFLFHNYAMNDYRLSRLDIRELVCLFHNTKRNCCFVDPMQAMGNKISLFFPRRLQCGMTSWCCLVQLQYMQRKEKILFFRFTCLDECLIIIFAASARMCCADDGED